MEFTNTLVANATAVPMNSPTAIMRMTSFQDLARLFNLCEIVKLRNLTWFKNTGRGNELWQIYLKAN